MRTRSEALSDIGAIETLTVAAFLNAPHSSQTEHFIVNALRRSGQLAVSLVAEEGDRIIGHVAVSPVSISDGSEGWYGLGPISVAPGRQGQGIGTGLIQEALAALRRLDAAGCVVLGEPGYYGRFGFKAESALMLPDVPAEYFQAIAFHGAIPHGTVTYHQSFDARS
jgi:putative acetyltransferase